MRAREHGARASGFVEMLGPRDRTMADADAPSRSRADSGQARQRPHYVALDGCRGIAAVMVALHHFSANSSIYRSGLVQNGALCVDFFFVLSGFVIAANY